MHLGSLSSLTYLNFYFSAKNLHLSCSMNQADILGRNTCDQCPHKLGPCNLQLHCRQLVTLFFVSQATFVLMAVTAASNYYCHTKALKTKKHKEWKSHFQR